MGLLRRWLKYQQYLPKQLQIPHSTSTRACIYYLSTGPGCESSDTEKWEQGWGASAAELVWGAEWCQSHISVPSCLNLAEAPQRAPVPALLLEGDGLSPIFCWGVSLCIWMFAEFFFFPKNKTIFNTQEWKYPEITWRKRAWSSCGDTILNNIQAQVFWKRFLSRLENLYRLSCAFLNIVEIQCIRRGE